MTDQRTRSPRERIRDVFIVVTLVSIIPYLLGTALKAIGEREYVTESNFMYYLIAVFVCYAAFLLVRSRNKDRRR